MWFPLIVACVRRSFSVQQMQATGCDTSSGVQALRTGKNKTVRLKIEKLSEEERSWVDSDGRTFLHYVVLENKPKLVPVVNVLTAQAHIADNFSLTPRALAVVRGYEECASMLAVLEGPLVSSMNQVWLATHPYLLAYHVPRCPDVSLSLVQASPPTGFRLASAKGTECQAAQHACRTSTQCMPPCCGATCPQSTRRSATAFASANKTARATCRCTAAWRPTTSTSPACSSTPARLSTFPTAPAAPPCRLHYCWYDAPRHSDRSSSQSACLRTWLTNGHDCMMRDGWICSSCPGT
jgi:hypothetical protein